MKPTILTSEFRLFFSFTWRDWSSTLIPALVVATWAVQRASLPTWNVIRFIPWAACYIYFFALSNQIVGVEEDRINKPGRPLPSGEATVQGARRRCAIVLAVFLCTALLNGHLIARTLTWVATTAFLCLTPYGGHWFGKNVVGLSMGTWVLLGGAYNTIAETTPPEERFFVVVSIWVGLVSLLQDLRDIDGDKVVGRKTLPIVAGVERSRWLISFVFLPLGYAALWAGGVISAAPMSLTAAHALVAYRVSSGTDARYDHKTYMLLTYLFSYVLVVPLWCDMG